MEWKIKIRFRESKKKTIPDWKGCKKLEKLIMQINSLSVLSVLERCLFVMDDISIFLLRSKRLEVAKSLHNESTMWECDLPFSLLEFSQPWVSNSCSQDGSEITEAAEGMVYRCGGVFAPVQKIQEIQGQHSWGGKGETKRDRCIKVIYGEVHFISGLWRWSRPSTLLSVKWRRGDCGSGWGYA